MSKNVLITGCSSGLGQALSQLYLDKGFNVWGISRTTPSFKHNNFTHLCYDLGDIKNIKATIKPFFQKISSFEYVYLNAGILGKIDTMANLNTDDLMQTMNINVYANKELLDLLFDIDSKVIVGISSGASVNGSKGWAAYSLSKSSLNMLLNLYAKEMPNSKLLAIAPGVIETPMTDIIRFDINDEDFPSAKVLKEGVIQSPQDAALRLYETLLRHKEFESGSFIDVRNI